MLTNQDDGKVVDIHPGKSKSSAVALFNKYSDKLDWVETVAMDFSHSYIGATRECFAEHYIVFDNIHVETQSTIRREKVRREIQRTNTEELRYQIKKHVRWLILRGCSITIRIV